MRVLPQALLALMSDRITRTRTFNSTVTNQTCTVHSSSEGHHAENMRKGQSSRVAASCAALDVC